MKNVNALLVKLLLICVRVCVCEYRCMYMQMIKFRVMMEIRVMQSLRSGMMQSKLVVARIVQIQML